MASNFKRDSKAAKVAEHLVAEVLSALTLDYTFDEVGDDARYYYKGDIRVLDYEWELDECFVEVKNDSRIGETQNVLIETKVWSYKQKKWLKANIESDYDYYAVVAQDKSSIVIMDWKVLKKIYNKGRSFERVHYDDYGNLAQKTIGNLLPLKVIKKYGGLMYIIKYKQEDGEYYPVKVKKYRDNT